MGAQCHLASLVQWTHQSAGLDIPVASCIHLSGKKILFFTRVYEPTLFSTRVYEPVPKGTMGMVIGKESLISKGLSVIPTLIDGDCNQEISVTLYFTDIWMVEPDDLSAQVYFP